MEPRDALIGLRPGEPMFFTRTVAGQRLKSWAPFVGLNGQEMVLTGVPLISGAPLITTIGTQCVVRYVDQGVMYGFTSTVAHIQHNPLKIIYLPYPELVEKIELRCEERFPVGFEAEIFFHEGQELKSVSGTIIDLSRSGCRFKGSLFFDVGDKLHISFKLIDGTAVDQLASEVRNSRTGELDQYEFGVRFESTLAEIENFIGQLADLAGGRNSARRQPTAREETMG
ncbi:MAG: flagellar brake protein [Proteobacteria bacterium]|nr:flagellar brake protein [Pseudomonadota bacterium]